MVGIRSVADYSPFGVELDGRTQSNSGYRYSFQGQEKENEVKGDGKTFDFGARFYDSRVGRFLTVDPKAREFPWQTTYNYAANSPLILVDENGEGPIKWLLRAATLGPRLLAKATGTVNRLKINATAEMGYLKSALGISKEGGFAVDKRGNIAYYNSGASMYPGGMEKGEGVVGSSVTVSASLGISMKTNVMDLAGKNVGLAPQVIPDFKAKGSAVVGVMGSASSDEIAGGFALGFGVSLSSYSSNTFVFATTIKDVSKMEDAYWNAGKKIVRLTRSGYQLTKVSQDIVKQNNGYKQLKLTVAYKKGKKGRVKTKSYKVLEFKESTDKNLIYTKRVDHRR